MTAIYLQSLARDRSLNTTGVPHFYLFIPKQSSIKIQIVAMLKHMPMHEWCKGQSLSNWFYSTLSGRYGSKSRQLDASPNLRRSYRPEIRQNFIKHIY